MNLKSFWMSVDRELAKYNLLEHPFYKTWSKGELTTEELKFYAEQYYRHVSAFPTYLTSLHARLPEGQMRRAVLANAWEEECAEPAHSDLWMRFVEGMGGNPTEIERGVAIEEIVNLVETFHLLAQEAPIATAFGAFYAYESQVPAIASEKLSGLLKHYGADEKACSYFSYHRTADIRHSNVWREIISALVERDAMSADEALTGVSQAARALWMALDGIERERGSHAEAASASSIH